jgi:hypothetical protein
MPGMGGMGGMGGFPAYGGAPVQTDSRPPRERFAT